MKVVGVVIPTLDIRGPIDTHLLLLNLAQYIVSLARHGVLLEVLRDDRSRMRYLTRATSSVRMAPVLSILVLGAIPAEADFAVGAFVAHYKVLFAALGTDGVRRRPFDGASATLHNHLQLLNLAVTLLDLIVQHLDQLILLLILFLELVQLRMVLAAGLAMVLWRCLLRVRVATLVHEIHEGSGETLGLRHRHKLRSRRHLHDRVQRVCRLVSAAFAWALSARIKRASITLMFEGTSLGR